MNSLTPLEMFRAHATLCDVCRKEEYGLCPRGFALLGRATGMRDENNGQLELLPPEVAQKPFVRMYVNQNHGTKTLHHGNGRPTQNPSDLLRDQEG